MKKVKAGIWNSQLSEIEYSIYSCFVTDYGNYGVRGKLARLLDSKESLNKRTKLYKSIKEVESLLCQLDGKLFEHEFSLKDLSFKDLGEK